MTAEDGPSPGAGAARSSRRSRSNPPIGRLVAGDLHWVRIGSLPHLSGLEVKDEGPELLIKVLFDLTTLGALVAVIPSVLKWAVASTGTSLKCPWPESHPPYAGAQTPEPIGRAFQRARTSGRPPHADTTPGRRMLASTARTVLNAGADTPML